MSQQIPESLREISRRGFKGAIKPSRGIFHSLSRAQKQIMLNKGFLPKEIKEYDQNRSVDFRSNTFQRMLRSRDKWTQAMKLNNWTDAEIQARLRKFLRKKGNSPWDFFRTEYAIVSQKPALSGSKFGEFLDTRRKISANFGRAYGRIQSVKQHYYKGLPGLPRKRK